jgi:hypothetical protein
MIYGVFRSRLLSMRIRKTLCFDISLSQQHSTSGGQYLVLVCTVMILIENRSLAGIAALAFSHYRICREFWSTERTCSSRTHYLLFAVECSLVVLMGYTFYLKTKFIDDQRRASLERK